MHSIVPNGAEESLDYDQSLVEVFNFFTLKFACHCFVV